MLTNTQKNFIAEYLKNGNNATQAYISIKPDMNKNSAAVLASRCLKKPEVMALINTSIAKKVEEGAEVHIASKEYLVKEAHEIWIFDIRILQ